MANTKEIKALLSGFQDAGHTVEDTTKGYRVLHHSGRGMLIIHKTLSDHRALKNLRRDARLNGFAWPLDS